MRLPNARRSSATLAVPVLHESRVIATPCLTTFGKSLTPALIAQYAPVLRATSSDIAAAYAQRVESA